MNDALKELLSGGESSHVEFKSMGIRPESFARELAAFSNTLGGTILIGVDDDALISGLSDDRRWDEWTSNIARNAVNPSVMPDISFIDVEDRRILRVDVAKGKDKPYQTVHDGKYWLRVGSTVRQATKEELSRLFQAAGLVHYDISPVEGSSVRDLDERKIAEYFSSVYELDYLAADEAEKTRILRNSNITTEVEDSIAATVGGLLVFSEYPERYLPQAVISLAVFNGNEPADPVIQKKEIAGALPGQVEAAMTFASLFVPEPVILDDSARRRDSAVIPRGVLREALVNALCHRDYSISTRKTQLFIFKDRLEIRNAGRLANTLTLEMIRYGNSAPRNMFLVKLMDNLRYIDGLGRGVPMILRSMGDRAEFSEDGDLFKLILRFV